MVQTWVKRRLVKCKKDIEVKLISSSHDITTIDVKLPRQTELIHEQKFIELFSSQCPLKSNIQVRKPNEYFRRYEFRCDSIKVGKGLNFVINKFDEVMFDYLEKQKTGKNLIYGADVQKNRDEKQAEDNGKVLTVLNQNEKHGENLDVIPKILDSKTDKTLIDIENIDECVQKLLKQRDEYSDADNHLHFSRIFFILSIVPVLPIMISISFYLLLELGQEISPWLFFPTWLILTIVSGIQIYLNNKKITQLEDIENNEKSCLRIQQSISSLKEYAQEETEDIYDKISVYEIKYLIEMFDDEISGLDLFGDAIDDDLLKKLRSISKMMQNKIPTSIIDKRNINEIIEILNLLSLLYLNKSVKPYGNKMFDLLNKIEIQEKEHKITYWEIFKQKTIYSTNEKIKRASYAVISFLGFVVTWLLISIFVFKEVTSTNVLASLGVGCTFAMLVIIVLNPSQK